MNSKILTFLRNNWLTILLAFIPPLVITYYFQRESVDLSVTLLGNTSVVKIEKRFSKGIRVLLNDQEIDSLAVVDLSIKNNGNRPIRKADFEEPVSFKYSGLVVSQPEVLATSPDSLKPEIQNPSTDVLELKPLLLNPGDYFTFRAYVLDPKDLTDPVAISGRVYGVKTIGYEKAIDSKTKMSWLGALFAVIGVIISVISALQLLRRAREITFRVPMFEMKLDLPSRSVEKIAKDLRISEQDWKSSLLLIRIKLEEQLRELASRSNLPAKGGVSSLYRNLRDKQILDSSIAAGVADVLPVINRELHASESYLSPNDFKGLQDIGLKLVMAIEEINRKHSGNL